MSAHEQFLQAIVEDPDNDLPRLVYADWLDEQGDPRGEYIRVQCELAQVGDYDPTRKPLEERQNTLFKKHKSKWTKDLKVAAIRNYEFRRGFVEVVTLNAKNHLQNAEALLDRAPTIREMKINAMKTVLNELLESKWLERLDSLNFTACQMGTRRLKRLLRSKHLKNIRKLNLTSNGLGHAGLVALATTESLPRLEKLKIWHLDFLAFDDLADVARGRLWEQLTDVEVCHNNMTDIHIQSLADNWPKCRWKRLSLAGCGLTDVGLKAILENGHADPLEELNICDNGALTDEGISQLATSDRLTNLKRLELNGCNIGLQALSALMDSDTLSNVRRLSISPEVSVGLAIQTIADGTGLPALEELRLDTYSVKTKDLESLQQPGKFHQLKTLIYPSYFAEADVSAELNRLLSNVNVV
ncbi:TIGR02996 domain-containing protein [Thalassoroseus pseudoceratinae]|uniref:TIGR02996 domain-containing protein n=1 Tax=Thalassoroseus pseudoceratinae TaxID=2713176 RepID=UPI00141F859F|nr:TIGR02996 domain-containing protein [Thalassoroseus pseudoceratinae]